MPARVPIQPERIAAFCRRHGIREMSLFGSVLRGDFGPQSDIDVLIDPHADAPMTHAALLRMEDELGLMFGRRVDLVLERNLDRWVRREVMASREPLYAAS